MTYKDIDDIIKMICPNDEDYEKPIISPRYLRQELEQLAIEQAKTGFGEYADIFATSDRNDLASAVQNCVNILDRCLNKAMRTEL